MEIEVTKAQREGGGSGELGLRFLTPDSPDHAARLASIDGRLCRLVRPGHERHFRMLLEEVLPPLAAREMVVGTSAASLRVPGHELVLEHERVWPVTYPAEWPAAALKDAGLLYVDLSLQLAERRLCIKDGHPWNILFRRGRPVFVDVDSIAAFEWRQAAQSLDEFTRRLLLPLELMAAGRHRLARLILADHAAIVEPSEAVRLTSATRAMVRHVLAELPIPRIARKAAGRAFSRWRGFAAAEREGTFEQWRDLLRTTRARLASTDVRRQLPRSDWIAYHGEPEDHGNRPLSGKLETVARILDELAPRTLLDIGANTGAYSVMAARRGVDVVAMDREEDCVDRLYDVVRRRGLDVSPVMIDVRSPTPEFGWLGTFPSAVERLKCDVVLALAVVHHLVLRGGADFEVIVESLRRFTRDTLVVEFVSRDDVHVKGWLAEGLIQDRNWYDLDAFHAALEQRFGTVRRLPMLQQGRTLLVCRSPR